MPPRKSTNKRLRHSLRIKMFQSRRSDSDPVRMTYCMQDRSESETPPENCLDDHTTQNIINECPPIPSINLQSNSHSTAPPSPNSIRQSNCGRVNDHLHIPSSPNVFRRTASTRSLNQGSASPVLQKSYLSPDFCGVDSISALNVPIIDYTKTEDRSLSIPMSVIYAVFLLTLGAIIYINDQYKEQRIHSEIFNEVIFGMGILWMVVFHVNLCTYKKEVLKEMKQRENEIQEASDRFSTATEFIINSGFTISSTKHTPDGNKSDSFPYRFLRGRHSGSFYLKIGSAVFCFGSLIYQGLQLGQSTINVIRKEERNYNCFSISSLILHSIAIIYAFYQLFITFKYSNIVINKHKALARFGLMHLLGTCLCNWFGTIIEEAVEDYTHMKFNDTNNTNEFDVAGFHITVQKILDWDNPYTCKDDHSVLSRKSLSFLPYLYPFAIEYSLLIAGVWFVVWQNIGEQHLNSDPRHLRPTISQDELGSDEIKYESNLVISADCHSANKGLFLGLFLSLITVVTIIVFFVAMATEGFEETAVIIHTAQEGSLTGIGLFVVAVAFYQIRKLDISEHPITFLDDVLLFVPLPFYFIHGIMSIMAEFAMENYSRLGLHILVTFQVIVQTPFIIDGLRRCSNSQELRYKKPGREMITFLIALNIILWIVNTFELKSVEHFHGQEEYFGNLAWMFIGHTTLPLMLFYRFHSSVCLADIWKSAYEKETSL